MATRRRAYLGAVGVGIAGPAGCTFGSPSDAGDGMTSQPGTEPPEATETPTTTPPPDESEDPTAETDQHNALRLLAFDAPDRVQLGTEVEYRFTVENAGDQPEALDPTTHTRVGEVINRTEEARNAPQRDSFTLLADDTTHHPIELPYDINYVGGEVAVTWASR